MAEIAEIAEIGRIQPCMATALLLLKDNDSTNKQSNGPGKGAVFIRVPLSVSAFSTHWRSWHRLVHHPVIPRKLTPTSLTVAVDSAYHSLSPLAPWHHLQTDQMLSSRQTHLAI
jgi:hypothetical protein